jgi:hypothetical protein
MAAGEDGLGGLAAMKANGCGHPAQPFLYKRPQQKPTLAWSSASACKKCASCIVYQCHIHSDGPGRFEVTLLRTADSF